MIEKIRFLFGQACLVAAIAGFVLISGAAHGSTHEFYKDKTVRIVVGFPAGGGFDTYSRTIARHIGKHIPGNLTTIVENMPGTGSLIAANHVYKVAKPDGLTIGNLGGALLAGQLIGQPGIEFDTFKFEYIGVPLKDTRACALTKASGITSMEKWRDRSHPLEGCCQEAHPSLCFFFFLFLPA